MLNQIRRELEALRQTREALQKEYGHRTDDLGKAQKVLAEACVGLDQILIETDCPNCAYAVAMAGKRLGEIGSYLHRSEHHPQERAN